MWSRFLRKGSRFKKKNGSRFSENGDPFSEGGVPIFDFMRDLVGGSWWSEYLRLEIQGTFDNVYFDVFFFFGVRIQDGIVPAATFMMSETPFLVPQGCDLWFERRCVVFLSENGVHFS